MHTYVHISRIFIFTYIKTARWFGTFFSLYFLLVSARWGSTTTITAHLSKMKLEVSSPWLFILALLSDKMPHVSNKMTVNGTHLLEIKDTSSFCVKSLSIRTAATMIIKYGTSLDPISLFFKRREWRL